MGVVLRERSRSRSRRERRRSRAQREPNQYLGLAVSEPLPPSSGTLSQGAARAPSSSMPILRLARPFPQLSLFAINFEFNYFFLPK